MPKLSPHEHLSGSTIAAAIGVNPYKTFTDLINEKRAEPVEIDNLQIQMGLATEETTINSGLAMLGLNPADKFQYALEHPKKHADIPLYYTDDGLISVVGQTIQTDLSKHIYVVGDEDEIDIKGVAVIEAKFTTSAPLPNFTPPLWRGVIQLQAGMMCHHAKYGILFTNYSGRFITAHIYKPHPETQALIVKTVAEFEKHMQDGTLPEAVNSQEASVQFAESIKESIDLDSTLKESIETIRDSENTIKNLKATIDEHQTKIMKAMGKNEIGNYYDMDTGDSYMVKWPTRNYKPKSAVCCPKCNFELEPAVEGYSKRQTKINIKELNNE